MKSVVTEDDINRIHHHFFAEPIANPRGTTTQPLGASEQEIRVGDFLFYVHQNDTCVSDSLRSGILFEKFLLSFVKSFIDPTKDILDIGANLGNHTVIFSTYTQGIVHAFEPQPLVHALLEKNIRANHCTNVRTYPFGASDVDADFCMNADYASPDNHGAFRICEHGDLKITCKRLDSLHLGKIGFIKMDVEGHELEALRGLAATLQQRPTLMLEIHDSSPTRQDVFDLLETFGYSNFHRTSHCDYVFT
jgi:FkbM family methyltransferase